MNTILLKDIKKHRNVAIKEHLYNRVCDVIVLSCGTAYRSLKDVLTEHIVTGLSTTNRYPDSVCLENRYYTPEELRTLYPDSFNATPGMLSDELHRVIGVNLLRELVMYGYRGEKLLVPCGSGETLTSLGYVLPRCSLVGYSDEAVPELCFDYSSLKEKTVNCFTLIDLGDNDAISEYGNETWIVTSDEVLKRLENI